MTIKRKTSPQNDVKGAMETTLVNGSRHTVAEGCAVIAVGIPTTEYHLMRALFVAEKPIFVKCMTESGIAQKHV